MLVGSLTLSIGFAIYDLTVREIDLSAAASQSQYAIYSADTGVECALYWDSKAPVINGSPSIFGTSSASTWGSTANCNGQNIISTGYPPAPYSNPPTGWTAWCANGGTGHATCPSTANAATTTFYVAIPVTGQSYCAKVEVGKTLVDGILYTNIVSKGYNNCASSGAARLERTLRVSY